MYRNTITEDGTIQQKRLARRPQSILADKQKIKISKEVKSKNNNENCTDTSVST